MNDVSLTQRAQQGDAEALSQLVTLHEPALRRFASRECRSSADADDAVQHALTTLSSSLTTFRGLALLGTWLFTIVRNECRRYERLARRWLSHPPETTASDATANSPSLDPAERNELLDALVTAIRNLRPELRTVFVLRELEELDTERCAERLRISEGNVRIRLNRARTELRAALQEWV